MSVVFAVRQERDRDDDEPAWVDGDRPPAPGEPGYASYQDYLAYEARREAFWSAHANGPALPEIGRAHV